MKHLQAAKQNIDDEEYGNSSVESIDLDQHDYNNKSVTERINGDRQNGSSIPVNSPDSQITREVQKMIDSKTRSQTSRTQPKRVSVMNQGEIYNQLKQQREMLSKAIQDYHGSVPQQMWYDHLRQTDDGRFNLKSETPLDDDQIAESMKASIPSTYKTQQAALKCFGEGMKKRHIRIKSAHNTARTNQRPFSSTNRFSYIPMKNQAASIYIRQSLFGKKDRDGAPNGQEENLENQKRAKQRLLSNDSKTQQSQTIKLNQSSNENFHESASQKFNTVKMVDQLQSKLNFGSTYFGKPHYFIRNNSNLNTQTDHTANQLKEAVAEEYVQNINFDNLAKSDMMNSVPEITRVVSVQKFPRTPVEGTQVTLQPGNLELDIRILDKIDSTGHDAGYFNQVKVQNKTRLQKVMNGMKSFEDLNFLKIKGVN